MKKQFAKLLLTLLCLNIFISINLNVFAQDNPHNMDITVFVPPRTQDLQFNFVKITPDNPVRQDFVTTYEITYGSHVPNEIPMTIEASWSLGTIEGTPMPSIDIVTYELNTATKAINNTPPIIDPINRRITWIIDELPASSKDNIVRFILKTSNNYKGEKKVDFKVTAKITAYNSSLYKDIISTYKYVEPIYPTSTPTPTPTPPPTLRIDRVEIRKITNQEAGIYAGTSSKTQMKLWYGLSPTVLNKYINYTDFTKNKILRLKDLKINTKYYFQIHATDIFKQTVISDMFSFTTARNANPPKIAQNSIIVVSNNNIIYDTVTKSLSEETATNSANLIAIPWNSNFQFKFSLVDKSYIKRVTVLLRKNSADSVLGLASQSGENLENLENSTVIEIQPNVYSAVLNSHITPGSYDAIISSLDDFGNLIEQKLADIKITNPFMVLNKENEPIEGARIFFYIYSNASKTYIPISPTFLNIENPSFTDPDGVILLALPQGKYKATVNTLGFKDQTVFFNLLGKNDNNYPLIHLERAPLNILTIINYYLKGATDVFAYRTNTYLSSLRSSVRFYDLIAAGTMLSLVVLTLFSFSRKHRVPIRSFVSYFFYLLNHNRRNKRYITGSVFNHANQPLPLVNVYLIDAQSEQIIANTKTNNKGEFFFKKGQSKYLLMFMKKGFYSTPQLSYEEKEDVSFKVTMDKDDFKTNIFEAMENKLSSLLGIFFEIFLLLSLFFELLFAISFGIAKTMPFLILSSFNLLVWILHEIHAYRVKRISS